MVDVCKCLSLSRLLLGESIFPTALQFESDIGWRHVLCMKLGIYIHRGTYISTFKFVLVTALLQPPITIMATPIETWIEHI